MADLVIDRLCADRGGPPVLRDVSLTVVAGSMVALTGANGAGKSTLLGVVSGQLPASSGRVALGGDDLLASSIAARVRSGVVLVPEDRGLFPRLTVLENFRVAASAWRLPRQGLSERIDVALEHFAVLRDRLDTPAGSLSGGQQQMLSIARALLADPDVLLLDEPSKGLAAAVWHDVLATCRSIADRGRAVLLVEQRLSGLSGIADRLEIMRRGQIVETSADGLTADDETLRRAYFDVGWDQ